MEKSMHYSLFISKMYYIFMCTYKLSVHLLISGFIWIFILKQIAY